MIRTQIYLRGEQVEALKRLKRQTGKSQSELIRDAIDVLGERAADQDRLTLLRSGRGIWENRPDLPDFGTVRRELDVRGIASDG